MAKTQFDQDGGALGLTVRDGWIIPAKPGKGPARGRLAGARVSIEASVGEPSTWAKLNTPMSRRGTVQGRARLFVTVACADGVTLVVECPPKHELAARRWAAQVNGSS